MKQEIKWLGFDDEDDVKEEQATRYKVIIYDEVEDDGVIVLVKRGTIGQGTGGLYLN